jgi:hypothetical protein
MSEETMVALAQAALQQQGIADTVIAVGEFMPRGETGSMFAGGMLGGGIGDVLGGAAGAVGLGAGTIGGMRANETARGLPKNVMLAVSETTVYGMHARSRRSEPDAILFTIPRAELTVKVHQRMNVRVLELIQKDGATVELEGNRLPITHAKDVIDVLEG